MVGAIWEAIASCNSSYKLINLTRSALWYVIGEQQRDQSHLFVCVSGKTRASPAEIVVKRLFYIICSPMHSFHRRSIRCRAKRFCLDLPTKNKTMSKHLNKLKPIAPQSAYVLYSYDTSRFKHLIILLGAGICRLNCLAFNFF